MWKGGRIGTCVDGGGAHRDVSRRGGHNMWVWISGCV